MGQSPLEPGATVEIIGLCTALLRSERRTRQQDSSAQLLHNSPLKHGRGAALKKYLEMDIWNETNWFPSHFYSFSSRPMTFSQ